MNKKNTEFIELYKILENLLSSKNTTVYEYENSGKLSDIDANKLTFCRNIRNYITHNQDSGKFVSVTAEMINFLNNIIDNINKETLKAKDICIIPSRSKYFIKNTTLDEIAKILLKQEKIFILDENKILIGEINKNTIYKLIIEDKLTLSNLKKCKADKYVSKISIDIISKDKNALDVNNNSIVTATGKITEPVIGICIK